VGARLCTGIPRHRVALTLGRVAGRQDSLKGQRQDAELPSLASAAHARVLGASDDLPGGGGGGSRGGLQR